MTLQRREIKKSKSLDLHKNNQYVQTKEPIVLKTTITLKPKVLPTPEPVIQRKHKAYEVVNTKRKSNPVLQVKLVKPEREAKKRSKEFLNQLKQRYSVIAQNYPLEIGIAKKIHALYPDMAKRIVNQALYIHTHSELYVEFLSKGMGRFDLAGNFVSGINAEGQAKAVLLLEELRKNKKPKKRLTFKKN